MGKRELYNGFKKMNRIIEDYRDSLNEMFFSKSEEEKDEALEKIYKNLVKIEIEANMLNHKVDNYLWDKKFDEDEENE